VIVLDASAVIDVLLRTPDSMRITDRLFTPGETLHAPHLLDLEVVQALRRHVSAGALHAGRAREALDNFAAFPLTRYPHNVLLARIWELGANLTAYDAAYIALAEALAAPLVTRDGALASVRMHRATIELL
jgi:predicted nucleic acid-binding protein